MACARQWISKRAEYATSQRRRPRDHIVRLRRAVCNGHTPTTRVQNNREKRPGLFIMTSGPKNSCNEPILQPSLASIPDQPKIPAHEVPPSLQPPYHARKLVLSIQAIQHRQHAACRSGDADIRDDRLPRQTPRRRMTWERCRRLERDAGDRCPQIRHGSELDANAHRHRQAQPACIYVRLDFVPLLSEVEIGFSGHEDAGDVI
jgi:hypothetical protein